MKKIAIIGAPGAGKSTLARQLGEMLNIEVTHLDHYFWKKSWKKLVRTKRIQLMRKRIQKKTWIIEGCYYEALDTLLESADTIIFLNMPRYLCFYRVIKRYFTEHSRPDLPRNSLDTLRLHYFKHVWQFPNKEYPNINNKIDLAKNKQKVVKLSSADEVMLFLEYVRSSGSVQSFQAFQLIQNSQGVQSDRLYSPILNFI